MCGLWITKGFNWGTYISEYLLWDDLYQLQKKIMFVSLSTEDLVYLHLQKQMELQSASVPAGIAYHLWSQHTEEKKKYQAISWMTRARTELSQCRHPDYYIFWTWFLLDALYFITEQLLNFNASCFYCFFTTYRGGQKIKDANTRILCGSILVR